MVEVEVVDPAGKEYAVAAEVRRCNITLSLKAHLRRGQDTCPLLLLYFSNTFKFAYSAVSGAFCLNPILPPLSISP